MQNNSQDKNQEFLEEYFAQVRRTFTYLLIWGILVVLNAYASGNAHIVPSFLYGLVASFIYFFLLTSRLEKSSKMAEPIEAVAHIQKGSSIRFLFVVVVLVVAAKIPQLEFLAVTIGVFSWKVVVMLQTVFSLIPMIISGYKKL